MAYLEDLGELITPRTNKQAKALIGKRVVYLCKGDIDRTGRGYYFPRYAVVESVERKTIFTESGCIEMRDLVEMVEDKRYV